MTGSLVPRMPRRIGRVPVAIAITGAAGGLLFAAAGAWMGSMNAGWFGLQRDANALFPVMGLALALVVSAWALAGWPSALWHSGRAGRSAVILLMAAPSVYVVSRLVEFAILGTLALGLGLVLLAAAMWSRHLSTRTDRVLVTLAAVGSLTWNTETLSAFLLVGVGTVFMALCLRLQPQRPEGSPNAPSSSQRRFDGHRVRGVAPDDPARTFAHRLVEVEHDTDRTVVRTRGDANPEPDPDALVISSRRTTVVLARVPALGRVALMTDSERGRRAIVLGIAVLLVVAGRRTMDGRLRA